MKIKHYRMLTQTLNNYVSPIFANTWEQAKLLNSRVVIHLTTNAGWIKIEHHKKTNFQRLVEMDDIFVLYEQDTPLAMIFTEQTIPDCLLTEDHAHNVMSFGHPNRIWVPKFRYM